jgi:hypothetical protein
MPAQLENVNDTLPCCVILESFDNGNHPAQLCAARMKALDSLAKFVCVDLH